MSKVSRSVRTGFVRSENWMKKRWERRQDKSGRHPFGKKLVQSRAEIVETLLRSPQQGRR